MAIGKEVLRGSFFNFLNVLVSRGLGLIFTIIVARLLQPELFGVYSLTLSVTLLVLTAADFGLASTLVRYVSEALGKKDEKKARSYFKFLLKYRFFAAFLFSLALFIFAKPLAVYFFKKPELVMPLQVSSFYLFFSSLLDFVSFLFFALKRVEYVTVKEAIFQVLRLILAPVAILLLTLKFKVVGVLAAMAFSTLAALIFSFFILNKKFISVTKGPTVTIDRKRVLRFALMLTIMGLSGMFIVYADSIILGALLPIQYVGFYRTAITIVDGIAGLIVMGFVVFPFLTQLRGKKFASAFSKIFHFSALISIPLCFGLALTASPFIAVLFGKEYLPASLPLYLLSFLIFEMATLSYFMIAFQAKERLKEPIIIIIVATILNVVLNYVLIRYFASFRIDLGMLGAAIATVSTRYISAIAIWILAVKKLKLEIKTESIYKPIIASLIMALAILLIPSPTIFVGILEIIFASAIYFTALFLIKGIRKEDILYLRNLIKK